MGEKVYTVLVTEYLQRRVKIRAKSKDDALAAVESDFDCANLILGPEDSEGAGYFVVDERDATSEEENVLDWHDYK